MRKITKKPKLHRLIAWLLAIAMLSGYVPQGVSLKGLNLFKNMGKVQAAVTLQNPTITEDSSMDAGQRVTWDCVWFGSYPQSEITEKDGDIYNTLKNVTGWDSNNDIKIGKTKYRRLKGEDATIAPGFAQDVGEYYDWDKEYTTYHYFKYEPIKWRVLNVNEKDVFLITDIALDIRKYDKYINDSGWYESSLRSWLNGYDASSNDLNKDYNHNNFIDAAFSQEEKNAIKKTNVVNDKDVSYGNTVGGTNTLDKIFLLSKAEVYDANIATKYGFIESSFRDEARISRCSTYAHALGTYRYFSTETINRKYNGNVYWKLRSPGYDCTPRGIVRDYGFYDYNGYFYNDEVRGVRPALHLNLSSPNIYSYAGTVSSADMAEKTYIESYHTGAYNISTDTSGNLYAMIDGEKYAYSDEFDSGDIGTRLPELDNKNVVYELHDEKIAAVYTMDEVLDAKMDVEFSTKDGITYRKGKFNPKKTDMIVQPTVILNNKFREKGLYKLLNDTERSRLWLTLKKLTVYPLKGGQVDFGSSGWGLWKDEQTHVEVTPNEKINLNETKEYKYTLNFHKGNIPDEMSYDIAFDSTAYFEGNVIAGGEDTVTIGNLDYQEGRTANKKANSDSAKNIADAASVLNSISTAIQFKQDLFSSDQMDQMRDFVNTWMADLILARCVDRSDLKSKIEDKVMSAWLQKMGYDISDVFNIILKPTTIQAVNYITMDTKSGKPVVIEFQINMFGFKFGDANGLPTMATGSGTATAYDMDGNTLDTATILPAYADVCAFTQQLQKVAEDTILDGSKSMLSIFGVSAEATAEALSTELISKVVNGKYGKKVFKKVNASVVQKALGKLIEEGEKYTNKKILKLVTNPPKDYTWLGIRCPVDVKVYDRDGKLCGVIKDDKVDSSYSDIYMNVTGTQKNVYLVGNDYTIELTGTDQGTMDYIVTEFDEDGNQTRQIAYEKVKLTNGCKYNAYVPEAGNADSVLFNLVNEKNVMIKPTRGEDEEADFSIKVTENNQNPQTSQNAAAKQIKVNKIKLQGLSNKIASGKKLKLTAIMLPATATNKKLLWKSSNPKVATVTQTGVVTLKKKSGGKKAVITAAAADGSGAKASWKVTSMKGIVKKVKLTGNKPVKAGKSVKLKAKIKATKKANKKLLWTSSNTKYATVNAKGVVKTKKAGKRKKVKITAMATDGSGKKATVTIKIK